MEVISFISSSIFELEYVLVTDCFDDNLDCFVLFDVILFDRVSERNKVTT